MRVIIGRHGQLRPQGSFPIHLQSGNVNGQYRELDARRISSIVQEVDVVIGTTDDADAVVPLLRSIRFLRSVWVSGNYDVRKLFSLSVDSLSELIVDFPKGGSSFVHWLEKQRGLTTLHVGAWVNGLERSDIPSRVRSLSVHGYPLSDLSVWKDTAIQELALYRPRIVSFRDCPKTLRKLEVYAASKLETLDGLGQAVGLEYLDIESCKSLKSIEDLACCSEMNYARFLELPALKDMAALASLSKAETVIVGVVGEEAEAIAALVRQLPQLRVLRIPSVSLKSKLMLRLARPTLDLDFI